MQENILLTTLPVDKLLGNIRSIVLEAIKEQSETKELETLLSPAETCKLFTPAISKTTLANWTRLNLLKSKKLGGRVYYLRGEVLSRANTINKTKNSN